MRTIFEYRITPAPFTLAIPVQATFLDVKVKSDGPVMWFDVPEHTAPTEARHFIVIGNGFEIAPDFQGKYLGTFLLDMGSLVFHLFELATVQTVVE